MSFPQRRESIGTQTNAIFDDSQHNPMTDFSNFKHIIYTTCHTLHATPSDWFVPDITPNFYAVRMTTRDTEFFVLCNHAGQWAYSSTFEPMRCNLSFIDQPAFSATLQHLFGITPLTTAELMADFYLQPDLSMADVQYWKPRTIGDALFHWWD